MELATNEKIRILCNRKGITITELAERAGWKQNNLSGKLARNNFCEKDLKKIADALGCKLVIDFEDIEKNNTRA